MNGCHFWVPWVPLWYPKIFVSKSMIYGLSNATSTISIAFLDQNLQSLKHSWFCSISWYIRKCEFLLENYVKSVKLQKNAQTHSDIQIIRVTRRLKAQISHFLTRIFLGTIVVPMVSKNELHSIEFLNKRFYVNLQMKYYSYVWYPSGTQNSKNKKYRIWAFQCRVDHLNNFPRSKLTKLGTFMILFNFKVHTKMWFFAWKIRKKLESSKERTNTLRYPNHACDTAFESPDIILFNTNIFGYHCGTLSTKKTFYISIQKATKNTPT